MTTTLVSSNNQGSEGDLESLNATISPDGSKVVFLSRSTNLVSNDTDQTYDVFLKDLNIGTTRCISTDNSGNPVGAYPGATPIFSPDGSKVAFASAANTIASGSGGASFNIYIKDLATNSSTLLTPNATGGANGGACSQLSFSKDGNQIAFTSTSNVLVNGDQNGSSDVFVKNLTTGVVNVVSTSINGAQGNNDSDYSAISSDGSKVAFRSYATNLDGSNSTVPGFFVKNLATGAVTRISSTASGAAVSIGAIPFPAAPSFSPDGQSIVFSARSNNLVAGANDNQQHIYLKDLTTGGIRIIDTKSDGTAISGYSAAPVFSQDGNKIAFFSNTRDFGEPNQLGNIYIKDLTTGVVSLISKSTTGANGDGNSAYPTLSNDALRVAFSSSSTNFAPNDQNGQSDVFVADAPCFATGTYICTSRGKVAVEALEVGDLAVTSRGKLRRITWIGHRHLDSADKLLSFNHQPVRVRKNAFGLDGAGDPVPARDLCLSPGHPVLVGGDADHEGGALVPIMCLINGTSIMRELVNSVTYWHVELDAHDILLAEGLPAESYLDWGDRAFFTDGADHALANPDFVVPGLDRRCRPVAVGGPVVEAERRRLDNLFAGRLAAACVWPDEAASLLALDCARGSN